MAEAPEIWVICERNETGLSEVSFELLTKCRELKEQRGEECRVAAVVLGKDAPEPQTLTALGDYGADRVYWATAAHLSDYEANIFAEAVTRLIEKYRPEVVLAGATAIGRAFFAKVAVRLGTGLTADCTQLRIETTFVKDQNAKLPLLHQTRPAFGGNIMATIMTPNHRPQMATVRPKVFRKAKVEGTPAPEVVQVPLELSDPPTRTLAVVRDPGALDITTYDVLVAGGRGMKGVAGFKALADLAAAIRRRFGVRAEVAGSRAAVDAGWLTADRQVGQTGRTVAPKLYLAFGISGAIQHLEGIRGCDRILAVNIDAGAPIFGLADVGIVGDAAEVIPAMIRELESGTEGMIHV